MFLPISYHNHQRYHTVLANVTPVDVLNGRREWILQRGEKVQAQTIERRRRHSRTIRQLAGHS